MKQQILKKPKHDQGVHLELLGNGSPEKFIGVQAVPGRLPELVRYPGESAPAFCARALHHVQGSGPLVAYLMYDTPPPVLSLAGTESTAGSCRRDLGLFHVAAKGVMQ